MAEVESARTENGPWRRGAQGHGSQREGSQRARRRPSSREAFIDTTGRLLRRQGYTGTGLNEIVALSGAPKGSLYFHFPGGKEELAVAAMNRAGEQLAAAITAVLGSSEDLGEALGGLVDALAAGLEASGYRDGCPIATVTLEAAGDSEAVREAAVVAFDGWLTPLQERLVRAGLAPTAAKQRALFVLSAVEGALILARAQHNLAPLVAVRKELVALASRSPSAPPSSGRS
jgi:TetR/AcrR family transcriptional repressor of lmrAB and yxaGH operons